MIVTLLAFVTLQDSVEDWPVVMKVGEAANEEIVGAGAAAEIVKAYVWLPALPPFVTWIVALAKPGVVGAPVIVTVFPELADNERPAGSDPESMLHENVPPVTPEAVNVCEYGVPTVPFGNEVGDMVR